MRGEETIGRFGARPLMSSFRDVRPLFIRASELITTLSIKPSELTHVSFSGIRGLVPTFSLEVNCFIRLCYKLGIRPTVTRKDEWLHAEFQHRFFSFHTDVWSKASQEWDALNSSGLPTLEVKVKRTALTVERAAIADKRRLIGLPAPKVIDV
jgi:hypothetical protein